MSVIAGEGVTTGGLRPQGEVPAVDDLSFLEARVKRLESVAGLEKNDRLFEENAALRAQVAELQEKLDAAEADRRQFQKLLEAERVLSASLVKVAQDFEREIQTVLQSPLEHPEEREEE